MAIRTAVPKMIPRGKVRCGSRVSPAEKVAYCHPSYAQRTPIIARPSAEKSESPDGRTIDSGGAWPRL